MLVSNLVSFGFPGIPQIEDVDGMGKGVRKVGGTCDT